LCTLPIYRRIGHAYVEDLAHESALRIPAALAFFG